MRYDKSLKLINYATRYQYGAAAGNLQLYTELDHSFVVGDYVYIVGGYYDNCNKNLYSTGDPFADFNTGYKILAVPDNNSFVIDYPPLLTFAVPVIFPYGSLLNQFSDPFDNTNKAYNCYTTSMEKGVYVSTTAFTSGIMKKGIINNGIFGNDYHTVKLNNTGTVSGTVSNADLVINHIIGKNIEISKGQINSKTDVSNLASSKIKLVEDSSYVVNTIPFYLVSVSVTNNNDGNGYNYFERITNTTTDIIINNGTFSNPNDSFIALNNITINKAKLGDNTFAKSLANQIDTVTIGTGYVGNINTLNSEMSISGAIVNTFIPLILEIGNATPVAYSATLKQIDIQVEYEVLANHYTMVGSTVYISGITGTVNYDLTHVTGTIAAMSYTYGTLNSAVISIVFDIAGVTTGGDWTAWKAANPVNTYDFTNIKIHLLQNYFEAGYISGSDISSYFDSSINFTTPDLVIENSTINEGYIKGATLKGTNNFNGTTKAVSTYLTASSQIEQDIAGTTNFSYTRIYKNNTPLKGSFTSAYIQEGIIHNSDLTDTVCIPESAGVDVIFLYRTVVSGKMYLDDEVYWDLMDAKAITKSFILGGSTYVQGAYLGNGRNTAWVTAPDAVYANFKHNPNRLQALPHDQTAGVIYHTQSIAKATNSSVLGIPTNLVKKIHVPSSENIQDPLTTSDIIVILDRGSLSLTASNWSINNNRQDVLYAQYLTGGTLDAKIANRNSATTLPGNDTDFPLVNNGGGYRNLNTIDQNYIYTFNNYFKSTHAREASDIAVNIYEAAPLIAPYDNQYPDPATPATLVTRCKIQGSPGTYQCADGATVTINSGLYDNLYLEVVGQVENNLATPAIFVPECFIEIERVFVNTWTSGFGVLNISRLFHPNSTFNNFVRLDGLTASTFTNLDIQLTRNYLIPTPITFTKNVSFNYEIIVEYWVTWYYYNNNYTATIDGSSNGYEGGARTKRTQTFRFN